MAGHSTDFPAANAFQPQHQTNGNGTNAFVTKFNAAGSAVTYSTFPGGSINDQATGIVLDAADNAYISGFTYSSDFPTVMAFRDTPASSFVTKISMSSGIVTATATAVAPGAPSSGGGALGWGLVGVLGLSAGVRARARARKELRRL